MRSSGSPRISSASPFYCEPRIDQQGQHGRRTTLRIPGVRILATAARDAAPAPPVRSFTGSAPGGRGSSGQRARRPPSARVRHAGQHLEAPVAERVGHEGCHNRRQLVPRRHHCAGGHHDRAGDGAELREVELLVRLIAAALPAGEVSELRQPRRPRRCRWHDGRGCGEPGRSASSCAGQHGWSPPTRHAVRLRRRGAAVMNECRTTPRPEDRQSRSLRRVRHRRQRRFVLAGADAVAVQALRLGGTPWDRRPTRGRTSC